MAERGLVGQESSPSVDAHNHPGLHILRGHLLKLKSSVPRLGSPWNKRWFVLLPRQTRFGRLELCLCYFQNAAAAKDGGTIPKRCSLLSDIDRVTVLQEASALHAFTSGGELDIRRQRAVQDAAALCFQIETIAGERVVLQAPTRRSLHIWVHGLQRASGLPLTAVWPSGLGPPPVPPPYIRVLRRMPPESSEASVKLATTRANIGAQGEGSSSSSAGGRAVAQRGELRLPLGGSEEDCDSAAEPLPLVGAGEAGVTMDEVARPRMRGAITESSATKGESQSSRLGDDEDEDEENGWEGNGGGVHMPDVCFHRMGKRKAYVVDDKDRRPAVIKVGEWESPEAEAIKVCPAKPPAKGVWRIWMMLITGGMFHVGMAYIALGGLFSHFVIGIPAYVSIPLGLAAYQAWAIFSKAEIYGAPHPLVRGQLGMSTLVDYLSLDCVFADGVDLDPEPASKPPAYVFGSHPHGIHAYGCTAMNFAGGGMAKHFPRIWHRLTGAVATVIFRVPAVREVMLANGYRDASRAVCERILKEGRSVILVVGGEQESLRTRAGVDAVWLRKRKGFIRLAMREGVSLVPTYSFGLVDVYSYSHAFEGLRIALINTLQVCVPLFSGVWGTPLPFERPVTTVVGKPIAVPHTANPGPREVEAAYNAYIDALKELFETHKADAGYPPERTLQIERDAPLSEEDLVAEEAKFKEYLEAKAEGKRKTL